MSKFKVGDIVYFGWGANQDIDAAYVVCIAKVRLTEYSPGFGYNIKPIKVYIDSSPKEFKLKNDYEGVYYEPKVLSLDLSSAIRKSIVGLFGKRLRRERR